MKKLLSLLRSVSLFAIEGHGFSKKCQKITDEKESSPSLIVLMKIYLQIY
jgi:hypothetical protein